MNFPTDPFRQRMLFRPEWRSVSAAGEDPHGLSEQLNHAFYVLQQDGFLITQVAPCPTGKGFHVIGQRQVAAVNPTSEGVPLPGTSAIQEVEVIYSYIEQGESKQQRFPSLQAAVQQAVKDIASDVQPLAISVTSITTYRTGDLHVLGAHFRSSSA